MNRIVFIVPAVILLGLVPLTANAVGFLHFKPEKNTTVSANHFLAVNGTSAASNATYTKCNVQFQTNGHGYRPVNASGPHGTTDYTKWSTTTSEMMHPGVNSLEAQLLCFSPTVGTGPFVGGNITGGANLIHHLVHNITAS